MGGCQSQDAQAKKEGVMNRDIENDMKSNMRDEGKVMKILLLGAGESGKSTIFKQMKIIHQAGYDEKEREGFVGTVHNNCIQNAKDIIGAVTKLELKMDDAVADDVAKIEKAGFHDPLTKDLAESIKAVWNSGSVQEAYKRRSEFQLADSTAYYFKEIDRLIEPSYMPSDQDILRTRVRTSGIVEITFRVDDIDFKMFDVGGQRNERRKWIHCFDNVQAVLFVAAMSEYDQTLYEDESQSRMIEALSLFSEICNSRFFVETAMILFLNKRDLFEKKIQDVDLNVCFPEYTGGKDYDAAKDYIEMKFTDLNKVPNKQVYTHVTCATDSGNIKFVFHVVKDIILTQNLRGSGFI